MAKVLLQFSMSLDGFVAGPDISVEQPMGRDGERLHQWMFPTDGIVDDLDREMAQKISADAGAVILGRRTFDVGVGQWEDTPFPVPSFVLTHRARDELAMPSAAFTFVTQGVEAALDQAKQAAGDKYIVVMGADAVRQLLAAGYVDEIRIQLVPVLLGAGTRLFTGAERIALTAIGTVQSSSVTHLRFEVERSESPTKN